MAIVDIKLRPRCANPPPLAADNIDSSNACNQASARIVCTQLHGPVQFAGVSLMLGGYVFPKLPFPSGNRHPQVARCSSGQAHSLSQSSKRYLISIGSAVFVWVPNTMLYNALSVEKKTSKTAPYLGISSPCRRRTKPRQ